MHRVARLARKLGTAKVEHALHLKTCEEAGESVLLRSYSKIPAEYENFYKGVQQPIRRVPVVQEAPTPPDATPPSDAASTSAPDAPQTSSQQQSAAAVSRWMLPWEKRQMDGTPGPLKSWERYYWGVFVSALAFLLFSRLTGRDEVVVDHEEEARKAKQKLRAARLMMAGQTLSQEEEEHFEGMTPQEIQEYIEKALGKKDSADPFEGMSPEEINEMMTSSMR